MANQKSSRKRFPIEGTDIVCSSKSEVIVGEKLLKNGYRFLYDQKYPYDDVDNQYRYDFMILNKTEIEGKAPSKHHLFIEVKDDDREYLESLEKKRKMVNEHDDMILVLTDKEMGYQNERVQEALELMRIKAENNHLNYESNQLNKKINELNNENKRLKKLLDSHNIKY